METSDDWLKLLDLLIQKEKEKEEAHYQPIELEFPLYEPPQSIGDEKVSDEQKDRGVVIIDL